LTSHRRLVVNANIQSITVLCFANIYLFSTFFLLPMKTDFLLVLSFGFRVMSWVVVKQSVFPYLFGLVWL
jgi:hypothetical protein